MLFDRKEAPSFVVQSETPRLVEENGLFSHLSQHGPENIMEERPSSLGRFWDLSEVAVGMSFRKPFFELNSLSFRREPIREDKD